MENYIDLKELVQHQVQVNMMNNRQLFKKRIHGVKQKDLKMKNKLVLDQENMILNNHFQKQVFHLLKQKLIEIL